MNTTTVKTTVKEFFERRDEFMYPSRFEGSFSHIENTRADRRDRCTYKDVLYRTDNGRYKVSKEGSVAKEGTLSAHTEIMVVYDIKPPEPRKLEKAETYEEMVARIAPPIIGNLASRYDVTGDRQATGFVAGVFSLQD